MLQLTSHSTGTRPSEVEVDGSWTASRDSGWVSRLLDAIDLGGSGAFRFCMPTTFYAAGS
jgi:hypothetical protein